VPGFYDGEGVYRVRFMPDTTGAWRYETKSNRGAHGADGSFTVTPAGKGNHGPCACTICFTLRMPTHAVQADRDDDLQLARHARRGAGADAADAGDGTIHKARMLVTQQPESYQRNSPRAWRLREATA